MDTPSPAETPAQYLARIGSKGGLSASKAKRQAALVNVKKAQAALKAKRLAKRKGE